MIWWCKYDGMVTENKFDSVLKFLKSVRGLRSLGCSFTEFKNGGIFVVNDNTNVIFTSKCESPASQQVSTEVTFEQIIDKFCPPANPNTTLISGMDYVDDNGVVHKKGKKKIRVETMDGIRSSRACGSGMLGRATGKAEVMVSRKDTDEMVNRFLKALRANEEYQKLIKDPSIKRYQELFKKRYLIIDDLKESHIFESIGNLLFLGFTPYDINDTNTGHVLSNEWFKINESKFWSNDTKPERSREMLTGHVTVFNKWMRGLVGHFISRIFEGNNPGSPFSLNTAINRLEEENRNAEAVKRLMEMPPIRRPNIMGGNRVFFEDLPVPLPGTSCRGLSNAEFERNYMDRVNVVSRLDEPLLKPDHITALSKAMAEYETDIKKNWPKPRCEIKFEGFNRLYNKQSEIIPIKVVTQEEKTNVKINMTNY